MFEFFIALFGGTYSVAKLLSEKTMHDNMQQISDARCAMWTQRLRSWEAQVTDSALQEDLWNYVSKHRDSAWREVQDAFGSMHFQKNYSSAIAWAYEGAVNRTKTGKKLYRKHRFERPTDIMLAKHGKLRRETATSPIAYLERGDGQASRQRWDSEVEFWLYIRDELRRHGVDAMLLFECKNPSKQCFDAENTDKFRYQTGKLVWLPCTWLNADLTPM